MRCSKCDLEIRPGISCCANCGTPVAGNNRTSQPINRPVQKKPVSTTAPRPAAEPVGLSLSKTDQIIDISIEDLNKKTVTVTRFADRQIEEFSAEEKFAEEIGGLLKDIFMAKKLEAQITVGKSMCWGYRHMIVLIENREHGTFAIYLNKNIALVLKLKEGRAKVSERRYNSFMASLNTEQAKQVRYDPTSVYFDEYWEKDVLGAINSLF